MSLPILRLVRYSPDSRCAVLWDSKAAASEPAYVLADCAPGRERSTLCRLHFLDEARALLRMIDRKHTAADVRLIAELEARWAKRNAPDLEFVSRLLDEISIEDEEHARSLTHNEYLIRMTHTI